MSKAHSPNHDEILRGLIDNFREVIKKIQEDDLISDASKVFSHCAIDNQYNKRMLEEVWMKMFEEYFDLFYRTMMASRSPSSYKIDKRISDKRFSDDLWKLNPYFNFISQSHLILEKYSRESLLLASEFSTDKKSINKLQYYTEQMLGALSPSNYLLTNPVLLQQFFLTKGESLLKGLDNLQRDLSKTPGHLQISMVDREHYKLGENIAVTPGKVVYQNDLIQLIQYEPKTKTAYERPLLFVPAFINKFYILDLNPDHSLIDWMVKKGYTVFNISWVNPDATYFNKEFEDYILDGPIAAIEVIKKITGVSDLNVVGYCIGGTIVACALAYLAAKDDHSIKSVTYLTTMLDFEKFGFFTDFINKKKVKDIDKLMRKQGYLDGYYLHQLFNFLRPNDLVWPYYIKNYLQGSSPEHNDLLFWNSDYSNIPPKVINYCLNNFCINNLLVKPNRLAFKNTKIDLHSIDVPAYFFSTIRDHLTPWKSTYSGLRFHSGETTFILGDSGHIVGVVNPPTKKKYGYFVNESNHASADDFLKNAVKKPGSWWSHWERWLKSYSGKKVKSSQPGTDQFPVLENAPGSYVKKQCSR